MYWPKGPFNKTVQIVLSGCDSLSLDNNLDVFYEFLF